MAAYAMQNWLKACKRHLAGYIHMVLRSIVRALCFRSTMTWLMVSCAKLDERPGEIFYSLLVLPLPRYFQAHQDAENLLSAGPTLWAQGGIYNQGCGAVALVSFIACFLLYLIFIVINSCYTLIDNIINQYGARMCPGTATIKPTVAASATRGPTNCWCVPAVALPR